MDVNLPNMDGTEATKRFKPLHPHMMVVGLSFHTDEQATRDMRAAETLLSKECAADELIATIVKSYSQRIMRT